MNFYIVKINKYLNIQPTTNKQIFNISKNMLYYSKYINYVILAKY